MPTSLRNFRNRIFYVSSCLRWYIPSNKFMNFYNWFLWNNPLENRRSINGPPLAACAQSFKFRSFVIPVILLAVERRFFQSPRSDIPTNYLITWHRLMSLFDTAEPQLCREIINVNRYYVKEFNYVTLVNYRFNRVVRSTNYGKCAYMRNKRCRHVQARRL